MTTKNQRIFITCFRKKSILFCFTLTICRKRYMGGRVKKRVKKRQKEIMNIAKETLSISLGYVILLLIQRYYFHSRHLDAPSSGRHHLSPAKHAHAHHTLAHSHSPSGEGASDKSDNPKKVFRRREGELLN